MCDTGRRGKCSEVIQAPAGALVEVGLPADHPPLPAGAPVYCSSSQDVKRRYRHSRPKSGLYRTRRATRVAANLAEGEFVVTGTVLPRRANEPALTVQCLLAGPFPPARDTAAMAQAARVAFEKWGDTDFEMEAFTFANHGGRFIPISRLNQVRRELSEGLSAAVCAAVAERVARVKSAACGFAVPSAKPQAATFRWSLKIDRVSFLDDFEPSDWDGIAELTVDIARDHPALLAENLERLSSVLGRDRIRLALPALTRKWEDHGLRLKIDRFRGAGWTKWEAANLSAWTYLGLNPAEPTHNIDMATDWSVYVVNRAAARQLLDMGVSRFTLSPEDGLENLRSLLTEFARTRPCSWPSRAPTPT